MTKKENIFFECTDCKCGMEIFKDNDGVKRKHRASFESQLGKLTHIKKGQFIPDKNCPYCEKELLIRV